MDGRDRASGGVRAASAEDDEDDEDDDDDDDDDDEAGRGDGGEAAAAARAPAAPAAASEANGRDPDPDRDPAAPPPNPDDQGSDDINIDIDIEVHGFREAVDRLEDADDRRPIHRLLVFEKLPGEGEIRLEHGNAFRRFVTLLGQPMEGGGGGRIVREIVLRTAWTWLPDDEMGRLFGQVLPEHPTLRAIGIYCNRIHIEFFKLLTESIPTANETLLSRLSLGGWEASDPPADREVVHAIVTMLGRNAAIADLVLHFELDADQCTLLGQAVHRNTNLRDLVLQVGDVVAGSLDGLATSSSLLRLHVWGSVSDGAASSLARRLRTNETLQHLRLDAIGGNRGIRDSHALLDLVSTYNYALHTVSGGLGSYRDNARVQELLDRCMRRNARIRDAIEALRDARLGIPEHLLPSLLGLVSGLPTALCRVLRMGYVNAVSDRLVAAAAAAQGVTGSTATESTKIESSDQSWGRSPPAAKRRRILGGSDEETGNPSAM